MLERSYMSRRDSGNISPPYLREDNGYTPPVWGSSSVRPVDRPVEAWSPEESSPPVVETIIPVRLQKEYSLITKCFAEFVGVLIFVFVGTTQAHAGGGFVDGTVHAAFAHGLTIFILVATIGHISGGHINPAVSLGVTLSGGLPLFHLPCYFISQMLGGLVGALLGVVILSKDQYTAMEAGATILIPGTQWYQGLISETIVTFILVHTILNTAVDTDKNFLAPFAIGTCLTIDILATGALTGASMNPARSFGPNLIGYFFIDHDKLPSGWWEHHYIYWAGPIIGSSLAAGVFWLLQAREKRLVS